MTDYNFIRYKRTLSDALSQDESVEVTQNYLGAIQLKPNDPEPYFQLSKFEDSITLGNYEVVVVRLSNCAEIDITSNVNITTFVEDGITQAKFQYSDIPTDFGTDLVYFKVDLHGSQELPGVKILYSNLILITDNEIDKTTRIDYIDNTRLGNENFKQSIRLAMYAHNHVANTEIDSYYQISTEQNVNSRIQENTLQEYYMPPVNAWTFKRIEKAFYNGGFWLDLVRSYLTAPIEYVERQELSNVSEQMFTTDPNEDDILNVVNVEVQRNSIPMLSSTTVKSSTSQLSSEIVTYGDDVDSYAFRVQKDGGTVEALECIDNPILTPFLYQASGFKAGKTYSPAPTDGLGDFTVVRSSLQTRFNENEKVETLANNVPSIDFLDGCPVLNNALQATNLFEESEDFNAPYWVRANMNPVNQGETGVIIGEDVYKLINDNGSGGVRALSKNFPSGLTGLHVHSVFAKEDENKFLGLRLRNGPNQFINFDLRDGTVSRNNSGTQVVGFAVSKELFDGWRRYSIICDPSESNTPGSLHFSTSSLITGQETNNVDGDGIDGIFIQGEMLETLILTPYIFTSGGTATRLETVCTTTVIAGVSEAIETIGGVAQTPVVVVPTTTYTIPNGEIDKIIMT